MTSRLVIPYCSPLARLGAAVLLLAAQVGVTAADVINFPTDALRPPSMPYVVKKGDTLWSISERFLNDPFFWPRLWQVNNYIINPDLIYPGNTIRLPVEPSAAPGPPPVAMPAPSTAVAPPAPAPTAASPPIVVLPPRLQPQRLEGVLVEGFIENDLKKPVARIVSGIDSREMLGENDLIYLLPGRGKNLVLGDRFVVMRPVKKVRHPHSSRYLGMLIETLGVVEVMTPSGAKGRTVTGRILRSYNPIRKGDGVYPLERAAETPSSHGGSQPLSGYIVEVQSNRVINAQFDVVYLDRGRRDGVGPGDRFRIIHPGRKVSGTRLPARVVGMVELVAAREETSTARILRSTDTIGLGDRVEKIP